MSNNVFNYYYFFIIFYSNIIYSSTITILIIIGLFINYELISEKLLEASNFVNIKLLFLIAIILASIFFFILRKKNNSIPIISKLQDFFKGLYEGFMIIFKLENPILNIFPLFQGQITENLRLHGQALFHHTKDKHGPLLAMFHEHCDQLKKYQFPSLLILK